MLDVLGGLRTMTKAEEADYRAWQRKEEANLKGRECLCSAGIICFYCAWASGLADKDRPKDPESETPRA